MKTIVILLECESVDQSTFCIEHIKNVLLLKLLQPYKTA
jgi:hypothetical protein